MPLYEITDDVLKEVPETNFVLEKDIQKIVEKNMKSLLNLEFLTTEFELTGLRIDSLGYDNESNSFVIVEYKKDRNFSVIDQGFAYLSLLLHNKAEFILKYNEVRNTMLKRDGIDWSQSRIIFISPYFTTYQRKAIEFKDLPIELLEVKKYSNNIILFNKIETVEKTESITKIVRRNPTAREIVQEIKVYSEEAHLEGTDENIRSLYQELKNNILLFDNNIQVKPKKLYIAFFLHSTFIYIIIRKSRIDLILNLKKGSLNDTKNIAIDISNIGHWGNGDYLVKMTDAANMGYVTSLIRQSFDAR
jgi:predicted transport protein